MNPLITALLLSVTFCFFSCNDTPRAANPPLNQKADSSWAAIEIPATASDPLNRTNVAKISFSSYTHNFGQVTEGTVLSHDFRYYNTGALPLLVTRAIGSCGCIRAEYSDKILPPGDSAILHVIFNSQGRMGFQEKSVTIEANTFPTQTEIVISCDVIKAKLK